MKALIIALAVFLTGCATDMTAYYKAMEKIAEADNNAVMGLAAAAQRGSEGAVVALAVRKSLAGQIAPPQDKALAWASVIFPAVTTAYSINRNAAISMQQIEAETKQYTATMGTIQGIATGAFNNPTYLPMQPSEKPTYLPVTPGTEPLRPVEATPTTTP